MVENDFLIALNTLERPDRRLESAMCSGWVAFCILGCALWCHNVRRDSNECRRGTQDNEVVVEEQPGEPLFRGCLIEDKTTETEMEGLRE